MTLPVADDLASVLQDFGVDVSVGSGDTLLTTKAQVTAADEESLEDDSGLAVQEVPVWIVFPAGDLGTLEHGDTINVTGPLAGAYKVDKTMTLGQGGVEQVLAR